MTISLSGLVDRSTALQNLAIWEKENEHLLKGVNKNEKEKTTKRTKKKEKRDSQEHKVLKHNIDNNS